MRTIVLSAWLLSVCAWRSRNLDPVLAPEVSSEPGGVELGAHETDAAADGNESSHGDARRFSKRFKLASLILSALLLASTGWQAVSYAGALGFLQRHKPQRRLTVGPLLLDSGLREQLERGEVDQPWNEELGLCEGEAGRERWYLKSEVDPANFYADRARSFPLEDHCAWPGRKEMKRHDLPGIERSPEERRTIALQQTCLERERYIATGFWELAFKTKWCTEPGSYPGPAFVSKATFLAGTRPGRWPLPCKGAENLQISQLRGAQLVAHLRDFIRFNNSEGSLKATLITVYLGSVSVLKTFVLGKVVAFMMPNIGGAYGLASKQVPWSECWLILIVMCYLVLEIFESFISYRFWLVVPKYGVLRQFQSFFGRQCLRILMMQATPASDSLKGAHEDRIRNSPGLCQGMVNYCCEVVVLKLWGRWFDHTRAVTTVLVSLLMLFHVMAFEARGELPTSSRWEVFHANFLNYGAYVLLFILLGFASLSLNAFARFQDAVDIWGVATKTKLNMLALQSELTQRMLRAGQARMRRGAAITAEERRALDEASSDWHDACRVYGNRDFQTWLSSWIITEEFMKVLSSCVLALCMVVLGMQVLEGSMTVDVMVMALGSVRSINDAFATVLNYQLSMPEGYVCLLYLAQVCNMPLPAEAEEVEP